MKEFLGLVAALIGFAGNIPYILFILRGQVKPHAFSWLLWGLLSLIAFAAQYAGNGGPGSWVTGITALVCLGIAALALRYGEKDITRSDWLTFAAALVAIPLWYATKNPTGAVILVTLIDALACYPTFRKSWARPHEESLYAFFIATLKFAIALFALETYSIVTVLYPAFLVVANGALVVMLAWRRTKQ